MSRLSITRLTLTLLALAAALAPVAQAQYTIPPDNPFVANPLARHEIYVSGMRNPYRWSFDRLTGDMWIGDVGGIQEEVTHLPSPSIAGSDLGWNCLSGTAPQESCLPRGRYVGPVHTYPSGPDVVIGGYVVRDRDLPGFAGRYLFGRLTSGIYRLEANGSASHLATVNGVSGFGEDAVGHLYATSLAGPVYRLGQSGSTLTTSSIGNFDQPLGVAAAPGDAGRLFIVEKTGTIKVRIGSQVSDFLDLSSLISNGSEQGLLAFAVAPDYPTSGRVFAFYTDTGNDLQLDEFRRTADGPDRSELSTRRPILTIQHDQAANHNGGQLLFGPDAMLYLSTGDGGTADDPEGDAQSLSSLLGKIIRIDVGVPPSAVDRVAPKLRGKAKERQRLLRLRGAIAYARCSENCVIQAGGRLHVGKRVYRLRRVQRLQPANKRARLKVLLGAKARRAIARGRRQHRGIRVEVTLRARDAAGNSSPLLRKNVRLRR
jgi:Glucose / Sorbosone dehydrogenase